MAASRGDAPSGYYPNMAGPSGVKWYHDNLKSQVISGTAISANVVYAVAHKLGVVPKHVFVRPSLTKAQAASAAALVVAVADQASATTSTNVYVCANKAGLKYALYILC